MPRKKFEEFIPEVTKALQPMLDAFLQALGIRRKKEVTGRTQRLQQMGRVTTGFYPEMEREVGEQFGLEETGYRAEHEAGILGRAMELFGISEQWERQQAQIQSEEKMADLNRQLTREGWGFQARQNELNRQLTREGWDWQSRENILGRVFQAEQSELDRALQRELAKIGGAGGFTFPIITPTPSPTPPPLLTPTKTQQIVKKKALTPYKAPIRYVATKTYTAPKTATTTYREELAKPTTYRGRRGGLIK